MRHKMKQVLCLLLTVAMVVGMLPAVSITASAAEETTTKIIDLADDSFSSGAELDSGIYFLSSSKTFEGDATTRNGLKIKAGATVTIIVPKNVVLTAKGCDGTSGTEIIGGFENRGGTGGGAGILLPAASTLILLGEGTVKATGGKGGAGGPGGGGGNSQVQDNTDPDTGEDRKEKYTAGTGGPGGTGGGGAGAGIGTDGGNGADCIGNGGSMWEDTSIKDEWKNGFSGSGGNSGSPAKSIGTLYKSASITITATGGTAGAGGSGGAAGRRDWEPDDGDQRGIAGGAGGGGGGGGHAGAGIGTGGGGGGQGGGGGSAGYIWSGYYVPGGGGGGGAGGNYGRGGAICPGTTIDNGNRDNPNEEGTNDRLEETDEKHDPFYESGFLRTPQTGNARGTGLGGYGAESYIWSNDMEGDPGEESILTKATGGNGGNGCASGGAATEYTPKSVTAEQLPCWEVTLDRSTPHVDENGDKIVDPKHRNEIYGGSTSFIAVYNDTVSVDIPELSGYRFMGYWTDPQSGHGEKIFDENGNLVPDSGWAGSKRYDTGEENNGSTWTHIYQPDDEKVLYARWAKLPEVHLYENGTPINGITQLVPDAIEDNIYLYKPSSDSAVQVIMSVENFIKLSPMKDASGNRIPGAYMAADEDWSVAGMDYSLFYRTAARTFARLEKITWVSGVRYDTATVNSCYAEVIYDLGYLSALSAPNYIKLDGNQAAEDLVLTITPAAGYKLPAKDMLSVKRGYTEIDFTYDDQIGYNSARITVPAANITGGPISIGLRTHVSGEGDANAEAALNFVPVFLKTVGGTLNASDLEKWTKSGTHTYTRSVATVVSLPTPVAPANSGTVKFDGWYANANYTGEKIVSISSADNITTLYAKWVYSGLSETGNAMHYSYQSGYADLRGISSTAGESSGTWTGSSAASGSGDEVRITFANRGFEGFYHFGVLPEGNQNTDYSGTDIDFVTSTGADIFTRLGDSDIYAAQVMAVEGNYVTINYIVENRGASPLPEPLSIGAAADVAIGSNSTAAVLRTKTGNATYLQLNESASGTTKSARIYLAGSGTTAVDRYWIGGFDRNNLNNGTYWSNVFNNTSSNTNNGYDSAFSGGDSALAYSWTVNSLAPGESVMYTVKVGVSEQENLIATNLTMNANGGQFNLTRSAEVLDIINVNGDAVAHNDNGIITVDGVTYDIPVRAGYVFDGWIYADGTVVPNGAIFTDTCIYASWVMEAVRCDITNESAVKKYTLYDETMVEQIAPDVHVGVTIGGTPYTKTSNDPVTVAGSAVCGQDITANLTAPSGFYLSNSISVTVGGVELAPGTGYIYEIWNNGQSGTLLIYGDAVTGHIVIAAEAAPGPAEVPADFKVTVNVPNKTLTAFAAALEDHVYTYQWYSSADGTNQGGAAMPGAIGTTYRHTGTVPGSYYYYCVLTSTRGNGSTATVVSDPAVVHVDQYTSTTALRLNKNAWRYGESAATATATVSCGGTAQIICFTDSACTTMTNTDPSSGGAAARGEMPTLPGAYFAVAYFTGNDNYKASQSSVVPFTIYGTMDVNSLVVPNISDLVYNGSKQIPAVWESDYYVVTENNGGTNAGEDCEVILTIKDTAKYRWAAPANGANYTLNGTAVTIGGVQYPAYTVATITYRIVKANNAWMTPLSCDPIAYGEDPAPVAVPAFDTTVTYRYSSSEDGLYEVAPDGGFTVGTWYVKAYAAETSNSYALESLPVAFTVSTSQWAKPAVETMATSVAGASDGTITVTNLPNGASWQYSVDGSRWSEEISTASQSGFAAGTYYVRIAELGGYKTSASVKVTVADGGMLTVSFNSNGGSVVPGQSVKKDGKATEPTVVPTMPGYTFAGWYSDSTLTSEWDFESDTVSEETTLYAKWTYRVTFHANNGSGTMDEQSFIYGKEQNLTANSFSRPDHTFSGWNTAADGSGAAYTDGTSVSALGNVTLYAQWIPCKQVTYTKEETPVTVIVSFDPAGGVMEDGWTFAADGDKCGALPAVTRSGYTFGGWYDAVSGGSQIVAGTTELPGSDTTFYAQWTKNNLPEGIDLDGGELIDPNWNPEGDELPSVTRPGYENTNSWQKKDGVTIENMDEFRHLTPDDKPITPVWKPIPYTITYMDDSTPLSGDGWPTTYTVESGAIMLPSTLTKSGFTFLGWKSAGGYWVTVIPAGSMGNVTLTAQWEVLATTVIPPASDEKSNISNAGFNDAGGYEFTINPEDGYGVPTNGKLTVTINGKDVVNDLGGEIKENEDGTYTVTVPRDQLEAGDNSIAIDGIEDITAPTATVRFSGQTGSSALVTGIDFDVYFNAAKTVYITARDEHSRIKTVEYLISSERMDKTALDALEVGSWTNAEIVSAENVNFSTTIADTNRGNTVVYVRVTDTAGNVTIISTNGVVFDSTAPVITVDPTVENGGQIKIDNTPVCVTLTDANLVTVKVDGTVVLGERASGSYTVETIENGIAIRNLSPKASFYELIAIDKAGNTSTFRVKVTAAEFTVPSVASKVYTGNALTPDLVSNDIYTVEFVDNANGWVEAGSYTVKLTFTDLGKAQYQWVTTTAGSNVTIDHNAGTATIRFNITQATNAFTAPLTLNDTALTYGDLPIPAASVKYGTVQYVYSNAIDGDYTAVINAADFVAGTWYVKAQVDETGSYTGLVSSPLSFMVDPAPQAKPTRVYAVNETAAGANDGKIIGVTAAMEYSTDPYAENWTEIAGTEVNGLTDGTYYVRYAAVANKYAASEAVAVTIAAGGSLAVTFDSNGGSTVPGQSVEYGVQAVSPAAPIKTGYTFAGWYSDSALTSAWNFESDTVFAATTLYAKWTPNTYTISFNANAPDEMTCDGTMESMTNVAYGSNVVLTSNAFTLTNNTFIGWNTASDGSGVAYGDKAMVKNLTDADGAEVILYAQWAQLPGFDLNGGTLPDGWSSESGEPPIPMRPGYDFGGWTDNGDGTKVAQWSLTQYTITYMDGEETLTDHEWCSSYTVTSEAITLPSAIKDGFTFLGWKNAEGNVIAVISTGSTGNVVLYAQWEEVETTVTLPQSVPGASISGGEFNEDGDYSFVITPDDGYGIPGGGKPSVTVGGTPVSDENIEPVDPEDLSKGYKVTIPENELLTGTPEITVDGFKDISKANVSIYIGDTIKSGADLEIADDPVACFNSAQRISISVSNETSGIQSIQYLLSAAVLEESALASAEWQNYTTSFNYLPDGIVDGKTVIVYVKVTNGDGQVSWHVSDKVVFDTTAPVITAKQGETTVADGANVPGSVTITVTDGTLLSVIGTGSTVTVENGMATITLKPSESTYTIVATDAAGNRSYFSVKPEFILIPLPTVPFKTYTGAEQKADQPAPSEYSGYYTATVGEGATNVGEFGSVILTLKPEYLAAGYAFTSAGTSGAISALQASYIEIDHAAGKASVPFGITQATNTWTTEPALGAATVTYPGTATVNASAAFGTIRYFWKTDGEWQHWTNDNRPIIPGTYQVKAEVTGNANYTGLVTETLTLTIVPGTLDTPQLSAVSETVSGKGDGKIIGLTTAMEYSTNGTDWTAIADADMTFAVGTYHVRYQQIVHTDGTTVLYNASNEFAVTVGAGRSLNVTFIVNGGSAVAVQSISYNTVASEPTSPTKNGYTFDGWYKDASLSTAWNFANDKVTADTTLYAKWTANTYTVTFNANDGSGTTAGQTFTYGETKALTANAFTRAGYTFNGWKDESGKTYADGATITVTGNMTLTAQWVNESFADELERIDLGGGTLDIPDGWDGSSLDDLEPTRPGYEFDKWVDADGNETNSIPATAVWTPKDNTVTIGSGDSPNDTIDLTIPSGTELKLDTNGDGQADQTVTVESGMTIEDPVKPGYVFVGWEQDTDGNGNVTLTSKWSTDGTGSTPADGIPDIYQKKVTFKVVNGTWNGNGNAEDIVVYVTLTDGEGKWSATGNGTVEIPTSTGIAGYKASGVWNITPTETVAGTDAVTYTITHEKNSVSIGNNAFHDGDTIDGVPDKAPENNPIEITIGNKIMVDPAGGIWGGFDGNGSVTTLQTYEITGNNTYNLTDPIRTGYTFVGWKTEEVGTTVLFTAQWMGDTSDDGIPDQFQVKVLYHVGEGETWSDGGVEERFEYVELKDADGNWAVNGTGTATKAPTPVKSGYTHDGWYAINDIEQTNKLNKNGFTVTAEITLVPAWVEKSSGGWNDWYDPFEPNKPENVVIPPSDSGSNVEVEAEITNKEAAIQPLDPEQILNAVTGGSGEYGGSGSTGNDIVIDLSGQKQPVEGIAIPKETLETIVETAEEAGSEDTRLVIKLSTAELTIDQTALKAIAEQAQGDTIKLHFDDVGTERLNPGQKAAISEMEVHKGYEAYITVNGQRVSDFDGGSVELLVPFELPDGYKVSGFSVWYIDEQGNLEKLKSTYDGMHKWFTVTHFSDYVIVYDAQNSNVENCPRDESCPISTFTDTSATAWYHNGVHYCIDNDLMNGVSATAFAPGGTTTRAQIVTILWRLEGQPTVNYDMDFTDVAAGKWYTEAIRWAASENIVGGYSATSFGPNDAITREQFAAILWRYCQCKGIDVSVGEETNILSYSDAFDIHSWAMPAMQWACGAGVIGGIADGRFMKLDPTGTATRAQVATVLQRFCENVK